LAAVAKSLSHLYKLKIKRSNAFSTCVYGVLGYRMIYRCNKMADYYDDLHKFYATQLYYNIETA
jgi:hypothetical protein